jgi:NAD(P)-dependent dehydrogenase (short-subunit alcohol dehydrogenase family)
MANKTTPKTAIISGGARGIGRCLVRRFLEKGYRVFALDIDEQELEHTTKVHLKKFYESKALQSAICNLRDVEDIHAKVQQAVKFFGGRIDVLVNNGGIAYPKWKEDKTMEDKETLKEWQA